MRLNFFGDICLQGIDWAAFRFDDGLRALMHGSLNVGNLEHPITDANGAKPRQAVHLKAPRESLSLLGGFQAVSLANNHIQDYGDDGCRDTLAALNERGIAHFGLGRSKDEALVPLIVETEGIRVALLGATRYANANGSIGTAPENVASLRRTIRRLKEEGCFVVPYFHWGYEYVRTPSPRERKIAHACIDAGADIVVGSHPHIYQAVEEYRQRKIFYSLGNFIFSSRFGELSPIPNDDRQWESFVVALDIAADHSFTAELHGYRTSDQGIRMYGDAENARLHAELRATSEVLRQGRLPYLRSYYALSRFICGKNRKARVELQQIDSQPLLDQLRIHLSFNSQDLKNRLACHVPWLFQ